MRDGLTLSGVVVECEKKPWTMNGQTGISYNVYVRSGSARDGAVRVKVAPEQFGTFRENERIEIPVSVFARASDYGGAARLEYKLDPEYAHKAAAAPGTGLHSAPSPAKAS